MHRVSCHLRLRWLSENIRREDTDQRSGSYTTSIVTLSATWLKIYSHCHWQSEEHIPRHISQYSRKFQRACQTPTPVSFVSVTMFTMTLSLFVMSSLCSRALAFPWLELLVSLAMWLPSLSSGMWIFEIQPTSSEPEAFSKHGSNIKCGFPPKMHTHF